MMHGIDVSNWQAGLNGGAVFPHVDFVICKATEGLWYVDASCNGFVRSAEEQGKPFGFYHFAGSNDAVAEADFFIGSTESCFGKGVPVLDWEAGQSVAWVNAFVRRVHDVTGVWPWIYANPWRFDQGGVEPNCARWVAAYPGGAPDLSTPPYADGNVVAWQWTSTGRVSGYSGNLDMNVFYGDERAWNAYVGKSDSGTDGEIEMADVILANSDTGVWHYWSPAMGLVGLANLDEAELLKKAGCPVVECSDAMRWQDRAAEISERAQAPFNAKIAALEGAVEGLASAIGADPDEIADKVAAAVEKKLESINIEVTVD